MLSKEKKFIFIHNFKTGGTSIEKKLGHFDVLSQDVQDHRTIKDFEALTQRGNHFKLSAYALVKKNKPIIALKNLKNVIKPELTKREYHSFYKFTFIRNPWARIYSWYANIMKDPQMKASYGIKDEFVSFESFLINNINHATFSQWYFITNLKGEMAMDFVGRFENLQEDFNKVCQQLKIEDPSLPRLLNRKYSPYTENYTLKTKDLVYKLYKKEIEYFKYEFET